MVSLLFSDSHPLKLILQLRVHRILLCIPSGPTAGQNRAVASRPSPNPGLDKLYFLNVRHTSIEEMMA